MQQLRNDHRKDLSKAHDERIALEQNISDLQQKLVLADQHGRSKLLDLEQRLKETQENQKITLKHYMDELKSYQD